MCQARDASLANENALKELLRLALTMVASHPLQDQLKGLHLILKMLVHTSLHAVDLSWRSPETFAKALNEGQFIEIVFGCREPNPAVAMRDRPYKEVVAKSGPIVSFMLKMNQLSEAHVRILWKCCFDKNDSLTLRTFAFLSNIVDQLPTPVCHCCMLVVAFGCAFR